MVHVTVGAAMVAVMVALTVGACGDGPDVSGLSCEELLARWQTAVYQSSIEACSGDGDCVAVGQIESCGCTLSGHDAVPEGAYEDLDGPSYFVALAQRGCRDDCEESVPPLVARCVGNRCQVDYDGTCAGTTDP